MRKLLLLLPLMALASCSGGHDLMSNEPFRMTCTDEVTGKNDILLVSPELPQATLAFDGMPERTFRLVVKTPVRLELRHEGFTIRINRETGQVSWGGVGDLKPISNSTKCRFEAL